MNHLLDTFCQMAAQAHEPEVFAAGLCGPECLLAEVMGTLLANSPNPLSVQQFQCCLEALDRLIAAQKIPSVYRQDATLPGRWTGLSQLIRSQLTDSSSPRFGECLRQAKNAFGTVWDNNELATEPRGPLLADCTTAKTSDRKLFSTVHDHLQPWTAGSWQVWDVLCQWNQTANPVAVERTPVLFASGGRGQVMRLVVEALPGPAGLVTPNWWRLGLCAFPTGDRERFLLRAVQRVIGRAAAAAPGLRLRWHLESSRLDDWKVGLSGRSVEAAAAIAALAVLERYRELQEDGTANARPILDDQAVVTAVVDENSSAALGDRLLKPVSGDTLSAKLTAAAAEKPVLDIVVVPATQLMAGVVVPNTIRREPAAAVGEAFELLRSVNRAFDRYGDDVRSKFTYHPSESGIPVGRLS